MTVIVSTRKLAMCRTTCQFEGKEADERADKEEEGRQAERANFNRDSSEAWVNRKSFRELGERERRGLHAFCRSLKSEGGGDDGGTRSTRFELTLSLLEPNLPPLFPSTFRSKWLLRWSPFVLSNLQRQENGCE